MRIFLSKFADRAGGLPDVEPLLALFLGAALLAVFLTACFQPKPETPTSGWRTLYIGCARTTWAAALVLLLVGSITVLCMYLRQSCERFQATHGRVTQANYNAVQTIWGTEQQQPELKVEIYHDVETTERIESEDPSKPAILRKKLTRNFVVGNPYASENHSVTLIQSPRKKGSAYYGGYETTCDFHWILRNPSEARESCKLTFPLPSAQAVYNELTATLNGADVLTHMDVSDGSLIYTCELAANETLDYHISFKSRGLSVWYFQVAQPRELRDFTLTLTLPDLPAAALNYPWGCMTPTEIKPAANAAGTTLTYRLDHALSNKGMGITLPSLPQPGETTRAVLGETERAWLLLFSMLVLSLTLAGARQAALVAVLLSTAAALGYGFLAECSDLFFGFWPTLGFIVAPLFIFLSLLVRRATRVAGWLLAGQFLLIGFVYPCAAGLDPERQALYLNLLGLFVLASSAWLILKRTQEPAPAASVAGASLWPTT